MNAIIPLNIAAIRVNANDNSNVVNSFKGRTAVFEQLPYGRTSAKENRASTGDKIYRPLFIDNAINKLGEGVHLHWELPDFFRKGTQSNVGGKIVFPHAPNRWLVMRYFRLYNTNSKKYGAVRTKAWVVESDYIMDSLNEDATGTIRPAVSVPLPQNPDYMEQPYKYMGRVVDYEQWDPGSENADNYLPHYKDQEKQSLYLTSIGFVGPAFSAYYPECVSVFGFWDNFADLTNVDGTDVALSIQRNIPIKFEVSYQVMGWVNDPQMDPLVQLPSIPNKKPSDKDLTAYVTRQYNTIVGQYKKEKVTLDQTPADVFENVMQQHFHWKFNKADIKYTLNNDDTLKSITIPGRTLCQGIQQQVVWDMLENTGTTYFLKNPQSPQPNENPGLWTDKVELAVGNTTNEALSALLAKEMGQTDDPESILDNVEFLLDALQLGTLQNLEQKSNGIFELEEKLHSRSFARLDGGQLWIVKSQQADSVNDVNASNLEVTLPLDLAEKLHLLNAAQKAYDQGRQKVLTMRKQLFMDWFRYINLSMAPSNSKPDSDYLQKLLNFVTTNDGGELHHVINVGKEVGVLDYNRGDSGNITSPKQPSDTTSLAAKVYDQFQAVVQVLQDKKYKDLEIQAVSAPHFWTPTDPVLLMEGDRIEPARRNGKSKDIFVRLSGEMITSLMTTYQAAKLGLTGKELSGLPTLNGQQPMSDDVQDLIQEAYFLIPMLADTIASALKAKGGSNNPAVANYDRFVTSLGAAQGGNDPAKVDTGLFGALHAEDYVPAANPSQKVTTPLALDFQFTNANTDAWPPNAVGWTAQKLYPKFISSRLDPFIPVYLLWKLRFTPLKHQSGENYNASNLKDFFGLDEDAIDYQYKLQSGKAVDFTTGNAINYQEAVVLSRNATLSLSAQIDNYIQNFPDDQADNELKKAQKAYNNRNILAQALSGFNVEQILRKFLPQLLVNNLAARPGEDPVTKSLKDAAVANPTVDDWYNFGFNSLAPIAKGPQALGNFGPLRSGFMEILGLEIVDVFGQEMQLSTPLNEDGSLEVIAASSLKPVKGDEANAHKIFMPPRLEMPTRLWFRWLSASHDNKVDGVDTDFVEMNTHPATSPVTGWVVPNHLDHSLFFYDANGLPIGSFGIEHSNLTYRTRAGNVANPTSDLTRDIGTPGDPLVNPHIADFMRYINGQNVDFLADLMATIECSHKFIAPANFKEVDGLAVLIGRPLALTRAVLSVETQGEVVPLSQSDTDDQAPFHQDVVNDRFKYEDREETSSAKIREVNFPVRMGDLPQIADGLIGFLLDDGKGGYKNDLFYSAAGPADGKHKVVQPAADTIQLQLNTTPITTTMLVDPRAAVHVTTGVLPVEELTIPSGQYAQTMRNLAVTFFTHPVLQKQARAPLPLDSPMNWGQSVFKWAQFNDHAAGIPTWSAKVTTRNVIVFDKNPDLVVQYIPDSDLEAAYQAEMGGDAPDLEDAQALAMAVFYWAKKNSFVGGVPSYVVATKEEDKKAIQLHGAILFKANANITQKDVSDTDLEVSYRKANGLPPNTYVNLADFIVLNNAVMAWAQENNAVAGVPNWDNGADTHGVLSIASAFGGSQVSVHNADLMPEALVVPLPIESGYDWSWIQLYQQMVSERPMKANAANDIAQYNYTPQTVLEGWLKLKQGEEGE